MDLPQYIKPVLVMITVLAGCVWCIYCLILAVNYLKKNNVSVRKIASSLSVAIVSSIAAIWMLVYPPFSILAGNGRVMRTEYHFFASDSRSWSRGIGYGYQLAWGQLVIQFLILAIIGALAMYAVSYFRRCKPEK